MVAIQEGFIKVVAGSTAMDVYLKSETHAAVRLLTSRSGFENRLISRISEKIARVAAQDGVEKRKDPEMLGWAIVRLTEATIYNETIAAVEPELDKASAIIRLILE